jgi:hypothetical protein
MKRLVPGACTALLLALLTGCGASMPARETMIPPADKYDVNILRDTWGVPISSASVTPMSPTASPTPTAKTTSRPSSRGFSFVAASSPPWKA